jgi:hypothetical protein
MAVGGIKALTSQNLVIDTGPDDITISYKIAWSMTLGSKSREKDLRRRCKARLQRWSHEKITDADNIIAAVWAIKDLAKARSAIEYLDHMLDGFRKERLTPKIVEEALGISSIERRRWIKDGRLPTSGAGHFKKGKTVFQFSLHAPEDIAKIAGRPQIIMAWREVDNDAAELTHLTKSS